MLNSPEVGAKSVAL